MVLPPPTRVGDSVTICDAYGKFATYPLTVSPAGNNLYGSTEDMTISTDNVSATFTWSGPEQGWVVTSGVGLGQGRVYSREIFTQILASETSAVTLNTPPTIVDVYADGKRLAESKYSLDGNVITFSPSLPASTELQVIEYTPIQLGNGGGSSSSTITWVYNGGSAIGGETEITLDIVVDDVPAIDINGSRQYKNLGFTFDPLTSKITLAQELDAEDEVVVIINGTPNIYNQIDYTLREVARVTNVKDTEVVYFSVGAVLSGYKVIYDKVTQRSYFIPELPTGTTAVSLSSSAVLVHSAGSVDLGALAVSREEYVTLSGTFDSGAVINVKNELLTHTNGKYRWDGTLPKTVAPGSTPTTTGGVGLGAWVSVGDASLRTELTGDKGFLIPGGQQERLYDLRAFVEPGDPAAPDYTQAFKRAIASGNGRVFVNVPVKFTEDLTIPAKFRVDIGECGYLYTDTSKVRIEGFINTIGGNDPYRGYIHPFGVNSSTVPGIYTMPVTLMVPEDYPTVQDAVDAIPNNYWQRIVISIADNYGNTGTPEDVVVRSKRGCTPLFPPSSSQQAGIKIGSRSADPSKVSLNSIQLFNCGGTPYSPSIEQINFKGRTHSDENASIEFYGCTSGGVFQPSFNGVGVDKCIEAYNSTISVESPQFGNAINKAGLVTKHGGIINYNSTQLDNLPPASGVLTEYVALPIGGAIIANDFHPVIGQKAQMYSDGVMAGFIIEQASKTIMGVNAFARHDITHYHTLFQDHDKFTKTTVQPADTFTYFEDDGLYMQAASSGGTCRYRVTRKHRLTYEFETNNYRAFSIAWSMQNIPGGLLHSGSFESGNYFGFRFNTGSDIRGVISVAGVETVIALPSAPMKGALTAKYNGKGPGIVQFFSNGVLIGTIANKKLISIDGTLLDARISSGSMALHEFDFVSTK